MTRLRTVLVATLILALVVPASALGAAPTSRIWSVSFADANNGFMAGDGTGTYGFVSHTSNGGASWSAVTAPFNYRPMVGVDAYSATNAWAVSAYSKSAWGTTNGGSTWSLSATPFSTLGPDVSIDKDVAQVAAGTVLVAGQQMSVPSYGDVATVWRTTNTGGSWSPVLEHKYSNEGDNGIPQAHSYFMGIDRVPLSTTAWVVGYESAPTIDDAIGDVYPGKSSRALIYKTTNSGDTWAFQAAPDGTPQLDTVAGVSTTVAWAGGLNRALRTTNGSTWTSTGSSPSIDFNGVDATSADHMIGVGANGKVARTMDGGATWKYWIAPSGLGLNSVAILSSTKAIGVGDNGLVVTLTLGADGSVTGTEAKAPNGEIVSAKTATALSLSAPSTVAYGKTVTISGSLKTASGTPLSGSVVIKSSADGTNWSTHDTVSATSGAYSTTSPALTSARYYKAEYAGTGTYAPASTLAKKVLPYAYVTAPTTTATQTYGGTYTASGYLKPKHAAGTYPVKVYTYHYEKKSDGTYDYVYKQSFDAKASDYSDHTKYSASIKLPYAGKWRMRTVHLEDASNAKTYSGYTYVTVKRTTLTIYAPTTSSYASAKLYGYLKYAGSTGSLSALSGKTVYIQQYVSGAWKTIGSDATSSSGRWDYTAKPSSKATYRAYYPGTSTYLKQTSSSKSVLPGVYYSNAPYSSTYAYAVGKAYSVWGYVKPKHATGATDIKIYAYHYEKKSDGSYGYVYKKTYTSKFSNPSGSSYSKYKGSVTLPSTGKWRIRVCHPQDAKNAKTYSSYRYVTVK